MKTQKQTNSPSLWSAPSAREALNEPLITGEQVAVALNLPLYYFNDKPAIRNIDEAMRRRMRAKRFDWLEIGKRFACDRTTAWRRWKRDMQVVADLLNRQAQRGKS